MTQRAPLSVRVGTRERANVQLRTWANGLPPGVISKLVPTPIRQRDWPLPPPRRANVALRVWLHSQQIPQPATSSPFVQRHWPNPRSIARRADLLTWIDGLPFGAINLAPLAKSWTNPAPKRRLDGTWVNTLPLTAPSAPPQVIAWSNPVRPARVPSAWSWPALQHDSVAVVPNVVGDTQAQAIAAIEAAAFEPFLDSSVYGNTVAAGIVISQYPGPGTTHDYGSTVSYVLSLGPKPQGLPKFYNRYRGYDARVKRGDRKGR